MIRARVLLPGAGAGPLLRLVEPLSFWGGVDPASGIVTDARHPARGRSIAGTVLALAATRGSSSSSAVLLELIRSGRAPAAIVLGEVDAILSLGVVVAREMGWQTPPVLELPPEMLAALPEGQRRVDPDGTIA
ncbi:MAG: aconitase X swivel domain-containing protein [Ferrovibrionaceae bacterium]